MQAAAAEAAKKAEEVAVTDEFVLLGEKEGVRSREDEEAMRRQVCHYLYFCTGKTSKVSSKLRADSVAAVKALQQLLEELLVYEALSYWCMRPEPTGV